MWTMIPSLQAVVQVLAPAFTDPAFATHCQLLLGWLLCPGNHTLYRVGQTLGAHEAFCRAERPGLDRYYNFFERSAWSVAGLAYRVAVLVLTRLQVFGPLYLIVDDTLLHKRGRHVWGLGWFRDAVASTRKRVATASGHNWVVLGLAVPVPFCPERILCLPLLARLHLPGKAQASCAQLARQLLLEVQTWFPERQLILIGDGAYACRAALEPLPAGVTFVGRVRADAALFDPRPPRTPKGRRGPKPHKGVRLPSPKQAALQADRQRRVRGPWVWQEVAVTAYGRCRRLQVLSYAAVWPRVLGLLPVRIVVVRDPEGKLADAYLFTTDLEASVAWVVTTFAKRWSVEVLFRASKQALDIMAPQQWCRAAVEKEAPWVWLLQSVVTVWYLDGGRDLPEAEAERQMMGPWDSEWSLRHMLKVLRRATLNATINITSAVSDEVQQMLQALKNLVNLAA
jgi:hypothetical protein